MLNFKSQEGQQIFHEITSNSVKLRSCFKSGATFLNQASNFKSILKGVFYQSFQKMRGTKRKIADLSEIDILMNVRKKQKRDNIGKKGQNIHYLENIDLKIAN